MSASDDEQISYLAGGGAGSLSDDERRDLESLRDALRSPASWTEPDVALEDGVVSAIAEASVASGRAATRRWRQRILRGPALGLSVGAVAVAAVAVAVALIVGTGGSPPHGLRFAMVVRGTALAPRARGSAVLTKTASGWRIELRARGLRHLAGGRYYEAWLKDAAGTLVPVGTFNDARKVTLWSGVPVAQFRRLSVTRQRAGAGPASSGEVVLRGTVH